MKTKLLTIVLSLVVLSSAYAQNQGNVDLSYYNSYSGINGEVMKVVKQSDGKVLIGGDFTTVGISNYNNLVRLNTDGTIDNSFTIGTGFDGVVRAIAVQNDGKIIVGGGFLNYNGNAATRIVRLNSNGTIDNTFTSGTGFNNDVYDIAIQSDGKIIPVGAFTAYNGGWAQRLIRLNSDGSYDNTLNTLQFTANSTIHCVQIHPTGNIQFGGDFTSFSTINTPYYAVIIPSMGGVGGNVNNTMGIPLGSSVRAVLNMSNGDFIVAGTYGLRRNTTAGQVTMPTFDGAVYTLAENQEYLLVGGAFTSGLAYINPSNQIEYYLQINDGFDGSVNSGVILGDSLYVAGGNFENYKSIQVSNAAPIRLTPNCPQGTVSSNLVVSTCGNSYEFDGVTLTNSGNFEFWFESASGCDSLVYLSLTLNQTQETYISTEVCDELVTPAGNTFTTPGQHVEFLTGANGCDSVVYYMINLIHESIETITVGANSLTSDMFPQQGSYTYQWYDCSTNQPIAGATAQTFTPTVSGEYYVIVSVGPICSVQSVCENINIGPLAIGSENIQHITVFPNPAESTIFVKLQNPAPIEIYTISGKLLMQFAESDSFVIDVDSLANGLYLVKSGTKTQRFVKQ